MRNAGASEETPVDFMDHQQLDGQVQRVQASRDVLVERLARAIGEDGTIEPLNGLYLQRSSSTTGLIYGVSKPSFCVIAQGIKEIHLGQERYQYDPGHYLPLTAELPLVGRIFDVSKDQPYLSLRLEL